LSNSKTSLLVDFFETLYLLIYACQYFFIFFIFLLLINIIINIIKPGVLNGPKVYIESINYLTCLPVGLFSVTTKKWLWQGKKDPW